MNTTDELKKELKEILELVKLCPANLQEKCFELLLKNVLEGGRGEVIEQRPSTRAVTAEVQPSGIPDEVLKRVKTFGSPYSLAIDEIMKVFSFDELGNVSIEVTDLKHNKTAQKQRRLALLVGARHQFLEGAFDVPIQELREMCVTYGCYDAANFSSNMKSMAGIFGGYKAGATNKLSPAGKKEAASLIKELAT